MTRRPAALLLLPVMLGAGWWLVQATGGTHNATTHVMYLPVVLAAVCYGPVGGVVAALAAGGLMAITPVHIATGEAQHLLSMVLRTAFYLGVGALVGYAVSRLRQQQKKTEQLLLQSVSALITAMNVNHQDTAGHSVRVAEISVAMGKALRLNDEALFALRIGGLLHDMGKLAVPAHLLNKPGRLTPDEYNQVKEHAAAGARILREFDQSHMVSVYEIVLHHHERLDGSGYPHGLGGSQISLPVRIVAVADVYDALISNRPYRSAMTHNEAMAVLRQEVAEGRLDGALVQVVGQVAAMGPLAASRPVVIERVG
jgi:putative nucleotidyltransferase with HDIG domain